MKFINLTIFLFLFFFVAEAQVNVDSHAQVIDTTSSEDIKLSNYITLIKVYKFEDLDKVKEYCDEIYALRNTTMPDYARAMADFYMAFYHRSNGQYDEAVVLFQKVITYGMTSNDFSFESTGRNNIAIILEEQGRYAEATEIYRNLIDRQLELDNEAGTMYPINNLGLLHERIGDKEKALQFYKKSYDLALKYNKPYDVNLAAGNMANIYMGLNRLDSALFYADICKQVSLEHHFVTSIAYANNLFAGIYLKQEKFDLAVNYSESAVSAFDSLNQEMLYISAAATLPKIYNALGEYTRAIDFSEKLYQRAMKIRNFSGMQSAKLELSKAYEMQNNYKQAHDHYVEYKILSDSVFDRERAEALFNVEAKYETAKKDAKITNQKLQIEKQHATRNYLIGGLVGICLLLFLLFNRFRYRQRINQKELQLKQENIDNLEQKQKLIAMDHVLQGQEEERKRIAKDLHDGLGGLLAMARFQLQHVSQQESGSIHSQSIKQAQDIMDNAYKEVRRISHDMMPSALANLGLISAVEDLADHVNTSGQLKVLTQFYVGELNISNQLEIAIYRVIQEAVNNAIKHAQANELIIQITENPDDIHVTIEDDGHGLLIEEIENIKGLGLKNMESRIKSVGGSFSMSSRPDEGLSFDILVPR